LSNCRGLWFVGRVTTKQSEAQRYPHAGEDGSDPPEARSLRHNVPLPRFHLVGRLPCRSTLFLQIVPGHSGTTLENQAELWILSRHGWSWGCGWRGYTTEACSPSSGIRIFHAGKFTGERMARIRWEILRIMIEISRAWQRHPTIISLATTKPHK
jgi:hypothetical protein